MAPGCGLTTRLSVRCWLPDREITGLPTTTIELEAGEGCGLVLRAGLLVFWNVFSGLLCTPDAAQLRPYRPYFCAWWHDFISALFQYLSVPSWISEVLPVSLWDNICFFVSWLFSNFHGAVSAPSYPEVSIHWLNGVIISYRLLKFYLPAVSSVKWWFISIITPLKF